MDTRRKITMLAAAGLAVASIVLSSYALIQIKKLSLPCPPTIPILNIVVPIIALVLLISGRTIAPRIKHAGLSSILVALTSASTFLPFALIVLSLVYASSSELMACAGDLRWKALFHTKDAAAIRAIQNQFRCCGYNSINDRAWPFPARDVTADACVRTLNFTVRCADFWHRQESFVAGLLGFASFLSWILLVIVAASMQNSPSWFDRGPIRDRRPSRFLVETVDNESEEREVVRYSDREAVHEEDDGR